VVPVAAAAVALRTLHYITRAGDTLVTVADRFNVSVEDLRRWNHLSSSKIGPHRTLAVSEPVHLPRQPMCARRNPMREPAQRRESAHTEKPAQ